MCSVDEKSEITPLIQNNDYPSRQRRIPITIEPMVFLHSFSWSLSEVMLTNQIVYQSCIIKMGSEDNICSNFESDTNATVRTLLEEVVQPYAATISMAIVLLTSVIPAIIALFLGPWSDKFGRKPVIAVASIGYLLTYLFIALISYLSTIYVLSPWLYVVANIPVAILGGYSVFNAGIFSFMNDITNDGNRTVRMGVLQGFVMLGVLAGLLISSWTAQFATVTTMFCVSAIVATASVLYLFLITKESLPADESISWRQKLGAVFNFGLIREMMRTCVRARPNHKRPIIWCLIAIGSMVEFSAAGRALFFLYTRRQFGWTVESYSLWLSAELGAIMLGNLFGIALLRRFFNTSNIALLAISTTNHLADYLIKGFATQGWQLYLTTFMTPLKGVDCAATYSILSAILPDDDVGKMYSMDLSIKAVTPIVSAFLFTYVYNKTIDTVPSTYLFMTSTVFVINLILIGVIKCLQNTSFEKPDGDDQEKDENRKL